jgi:hypothetical protein
MGNSLMIPPSAGGKVSTKTTRSMRSTRASAAPHATLPPPL